MGLLRNLYFDFSFVKDGLTFWMPKRNEKKDKAQHQVSGVSHHPAHHAPAHEQPSPASSPPMELPSVSRKLLEEHKEAIRDDPIPKELPRLHRPAPAPQREVRQPPKMAAIEDTVKQAEAPIEVHPQVIVKESLPPASKSKYTHHSFFSSLLSHMEAEESIIHSEGSPKEKVLSDLFSEMKGFWDEKKSLLKRELESKEMEEDLAGRIQDLHQRELEWQKLKLESERIEEELYRREMEIDSRIREFKRLYMKLLVSADVEKGKSFQLHGGREIMSVRGLAQELTTMDDDLFRYHVNDSKNDFATWVADVFGMKELADRMRRARSQAEMYSEISSYLAF